MSNTSESTKLSSVVVKLAARHAYWVVYLFVNPFLILYCSISEEQAFSGRFYPTSIGFIFAQIALIVFWFVYSTKQWFIRWPIALAVLAFTLWLTTIRLDVEGHYYYYYGGEFFYGSTVLVLLPVCGVFRFFLGPVAREKKDEQKYSRQLTMLMLFGWTSLVATLVAFIQNRWEDYAQEPSLVDYSFMAGCSVATSLVAGWLIFTGRPKRWTLFTWTFALFAGMVALYLVHPNNTLYSAENFWHFEMIYFSQAVLITGILWLARRSGLTRISRC